MTYCHTMHDNYYGFGKGIFFTELGNDTIVVVIIIGSCLYRSIASYI